MKEITIIEDDKITQYLLKMLLVKEGYIVNCVIDGNEIFENESLLAVDLIIVDIMLPTIFNSAKLISLYKNIVAPIVVISSMKKFDGISFTKKINGESFFGKPFDLKEIIYEVNDLLKTSVQRESNYLTKVS